MKNVPTELYEKGFICSCSLEACFQVTDLSSGNFFILMGPLDGTLREILSLLAQLASTFCSSFPASPSTPRLLKYSNAEGRDIPVNKFIDKTCSHWISSAAFYGIRMGPVIACSEISLVP